MGEYAGGIFWVVGIALIASWFVAVMFTPYLGTVLLPDVARRHAAGGGAHGAYDSRVYRMLRSVIAACVRRRGLVVLTTLGIFALSVVGFGRVQQQFFPISERPELFLELRMPAGTSIGATSATVQRAETLLKGDADIATYTAYVGRGAPRFWLGLNPQQPDPAFGQIVIQSKDVAARERIKARLEQRRRGGRTVRRAGPCGPLQFRPAGRFPVQFRVIGPDPLEVRQIAYQCPRCHAREPGRHRPEFGLERAEPSIRLEVDQDRARALGLTPQDDRADPCRPC